jgi:16S rRNA (adenine1518-N6/adenine1519-N6)-dimethyltransferase
MMRDVSSVAEVNRLLKSRGLKPCKSLGQNFLVDSNLLTKIVAAADIDEKTGVIEIGPGLGALTDKLLEKAGKVVAIEIDRELAALLRERYEGENRLTILEQDILTSSLEQIIEIELKDYKKLKVVANLPYYITSPIIIKLLEENIHFDSLTLMVQKEVAERLTASLGNKEYGSLTVFVNYYADVKIAFNVSRNVFVPKPEVDSAIIQLMPHREKPFRPVDEQLFFSTLRAGFRHRRKTLTNNLIMEFAGDLSREEINEVLGAVSIDGMRRAETLSPAEFVKLADGLSTALFGK